MKKTTLLLLGFALLSNGYAYSGKAPIKSVIAGQTAPDFSVKDAHGKTHQLSNYRGSFVVLEWLNYGCPYVKKHYNSGNMQKLQKQLTEDKVVWLSIVSSAPGKQGHLTPEEAKRSQVNKKASMSAILLDSEGEVGRLYGAKTTPHMFLIDKSGKVVYAGAIDDKRSTDPEDIAGAKNYLLAAYQSAKAGEKVAEATTDPYGCSVKY